MDENKRGWMQLGTRQGAGLAAGAFAIVAATVVAGYFLLRPDYQVLFSELAPQDAALMVAELDRLKIPYRIEGETIFVPGDQVHKTRMKLMAKDFPMHGAVGFELFNNADFGMTEFAQKVNYQRALQGELTRTIMAMEDVQGARVHIAMPEQGLFRKSTARPKASITVAMKAGRTLRPDQVAGIQRLVSSAIPDISAQDVTIVNQRGVALTRAESGDGSPVDASNSRLDSKRAVEEYLAKKVSDVLDRALGPGQAMATVDVQLNLDQTRVTTEDVLPAATGANPAGVMVRQRQMSRDASPPAALPDVGRHDAGGGNVEIDYQVGHRTEQVVSAPGAVQRLGVAVVLKAPADKAQLERIRDLVGVAVGYESDRGDSVAVYSMDQLPAGSPAPVALAAELAANEPVSVPTNLSVPARAGATLREELAASATWLTWLVAAIVLLGAAAYARQRMGRAQPEGAKLLGSAERDAALGKLREWLDTSHASPEAKR